MAPPAWVCPPWRKSQAEKHDLKTAAVASSSSAAAVSQDPAASLEVRDPRVWPETQSALSGKNPLQLWRTPGSVVQEVAQYEKTENAHRHSAEKTTGSVATRGHSPKACRFLQPRASNSLNLLTVRASKLGGLKARRPEGHNAGSGRENWPRIAREWAADTDPSFLANDECSPQKQQSFVGPPVVIGGIRVPYFLNAAGAHTLLSQTSHVGCKFLSLLRFVI